MPLHSCGSRFTLAEGEQHEVLQENAARPEAQRGERERSEEAVGAVHEQHLREDARAPLRHEGVELVKPDRVDQLFSLPDDVSAAEGFG